MNFNVNFNVLLSKYMVHPLIKIKKTLTISRCMTQLWGGGGNLAVFFTRVEQAQPQGERINRAFDEGRLNRCSFPRYG